MSYDLDEWGWWLLSEENEEEKRFYCKKCGKKISKKEYESYDGLCWECWDNQLTEEDEMI